MLIKPDIKDEEIIRCLRNAYELNIIKISFLPLGADFNTAVFRVTANDSTDYFLKLRRGKFSKSSVLVPKYLCDQAIKQVIPPLVNKLEQLWTSFGTFNAILYPYIEGNNAIDMSLSEKHWIEFGETMKKFHSANIPTKITSDVQQEAFSDKWRKKLKVFLNHIEDEVFEDSIAEGLALFMKSKRNEMIELIRHSEHIAKALQKQPVEYVLCHADIHGWNLLISEQGALYIVDWDTLIFAPKERDLMFIGAGIGETLRAPIEEERLFYQGYGFADINLNAIAYYRFERIIEDISEYCEHIFLSDEGTEDRMQSFKYLQSIFAPNGALERAFQAHNAQ